MTGAVLRLLAAASMKGCAIPWPPVTTPLGAL
jgi:hypothetical protein